MSEQCGTPAYIAPEILKDRGYDGFGVDIWSTGVVLYAMVYGTVPFRATDMSDLHKLIMKGKYTLKPDVSEEVRDLLSKMLEVDPKKRYTIPEILCHPWFSNYDNSISLFTQEEKENIAKEFTYAKRNNRNQGLENGTATVQSDWFIEQNLDITQSELTKNITSKSVMLAPFNSTITNKEDKKEYMIDEDQIINKRIIKLDPKVKEIDRQYERNNNCEVDNGVYNNCDTNNNMTKEDKNNLNPLGTDDSFDDSESPKLRHPEDSKLNTNLVSNEIIRNGLLNSLVPKSLVINNMIIRQIEELGYPKNYVIEGLEKSWRNYATTTYYLQIGRASCRERVYVLV